MMIHMQNALSRIHSAPQENEERIPVLSPAVGAVDQFLGGIEDKSREYGNILMDALGKLTSGIPSAIGNVWSFVTSLPEAAWKGVDTIGTSLAKIVGNAPPPESRPPQYVAALPVTMDSYTAIQPNYSVAQPIQEPLGGVVHVSVPYARNVQDEGELRSYIQTMQEQLRPHIMQEILRRNMNVSHMDLMELTDRAVADIANMVLERGQADILASKVLGGTTDPSILTPDQIVQLQKLGILNAQGQVIPGASLSIQESGSHRAMDDKNEYPLQYSVVVPSQAASDNAAAIAARSLMAGYVDPRYYAPEFVPVYGAKMPEPMKGRTVSTSTQRSLSVSMPQPPMLRAGGGGASRPAVVIPDITVNTAIGHRGVMSIPGPRILEGSSGLVSSYASTVHQDSNLDSTIPELAQIVGELTGVSNATQLGTQAKEVMNRIRHGYSQVGKGQVLPAIKSDLDTISKLFGHTDSASLLQTLSNQAQHLTDTKLLAAAIEMLNQIQGTPDSVSRSSTDAGIQQNLREELNKIVQGGDQASLVQFAGRLSTSARKFVQALHNNQLPDYPTVRDTYQLLWLATTSPTVLSAIVPKGSPIAKTNEAGRASIQAYKKAKNIVTKLVGTGGDRLYAAGTTDEHPWKERFGYDALGMMLSLMSGIVGRLGEKVPVTQLR